MLAAMGRDGEDVQDLGVAACARASPRRGGGGTAHAQNAAEVAFWNRVRDSSNASELRAYLEAYPNGAFADTARARLKQLGPVALQPQVACSRQGMR